MAQTFSDSFNGFPFGFFVVGERNLFARAKYGEGLRVLRSKANQSLLITVLDEG
jgi:hypothetical protein